MVSGSDEPSRDGALIMTRDLGRIVRRSGETAPRTTAGSPRRFARTPVVEPLEDRQLLSFYTGPTTVRPLVAPGGMYTLSISGPGFEKVTKNAKGVVTVTLFGTTSQTTLTETLTHPRLHAASTPLRIGAIRVISGQLGSIVAPDSVLAGTISPISGSVSSLQFNSLDQNARVDIAGTLGSLTVGSVNLGPNGHVVIGGDLGQSLSVGAMNLNGGGFLIGNDLMGALNAGSITLDHGGLFSVNNDLQGSVTVSGNLSASNNSRFNVGRDVTGSMNIGGNLALASNGVVTLGRGLENLTVNGNLTVAPSGGEVLVGGNLTSLTVNGAFIGKGSKSTPDLVVGLNLGSLSVLGGGAGQGGIQNANIEVTKSILGLNVPHGIFNSFITAGVLIDGGANTNGNVGADGTAAIYNSEIRSGGDINHLTINGDVQSTFATNPNSTGYPTRIVAGEDRAGNFVSGAVIDHFVIQGSLMDAVVAASWAPNGGNGQLPTYTYGSPPPSWTNIPGDVGYDTYDAPAGTITGGTVGAPIKYLNFSPVNIYNEQVVGVKYDTTSGAADPTIDDTILPGSINPSFATTPLDPQTLTNPDSVLPLPSQSTVDKLVISTPHGDAADYAGFFAADVRGVFIGKLPG